MELNYKYLLSSMCCFILIIYLIVPTPNVIFKLDDTLHKISKCSVSV